MKLTEVFTYLATGELSKVFLAETGGRDVVADDKQRPLAQSIQLGLTALHKRFSLKNKQLTLQLQNGKADYELHSRFLVSSTSTEPVKYIEDSPLYPFKDDILDVTAVFTNEGYDYPLNIRNDRYSAYFVNGKNLVIPKELVTDYIDLPEHFKTGKLKVDYRANHPSIIPRVGPINADRTEIDLPMSHLQALLYFVASRQTNPMGMVNEFNSGNNWYQKYELECRQLENEGLGLNVDLSHNRFQRNGWV